MELFTYPTALVFATLMAVILSSPFVFITSILFTKWLEWTTRGKVIYYDPVHRWYRKYLMIDSYSIAPQERSIACKKDIELIYPIFSAIWFIILGVAMFIVNRENKNAIDTLTHLFFGTWLELGVLLAAPLFIISTFFAISYGSRYTFTLYDKAITRLQEVEKKSHTHD